MSAPIDDAPRAQPVPRPGPWRRPLVLVIAALAIVALVVVLVIFQPQRLFYDVAVDDEFPTVASGDDGASEDLEDQPGAADPDGEVDGSDEVDAEAEAEEGDPSAPEDELQEQADEGGGEPDLAAEEAVAEEPTEPVALSTGRFESRNRYTTTGTATAFELPDGTRTLRLEDFETTNGPDLYVYLTVGDAADTDDDFVDLGDLRGNVGNQNYPIPDDVDLDLYDTVVIWCLRFTSSFGVADLDAG